MKKALATVRSNKGFTLIELMVVVAIIGILAAIAIPQFSEYRERSFVASQKADCKSLMTANECYYVDNNVFPCTAAELQGYGFDNVTPGNVLTVVSTPSGFQWTVTNPRTSAVAFFQTTINGAGYMTQMSVNLEQF